MKLYAILTPEVDGNFFIVRECSTNKKSVERILDKIISKESHGLEYIALAEYDIDDTICNLTTDYTILEAYKPRFGSYGEWRKK